MSTEKQTKKQIEPSVRYLQARLRVFGQVEIWGAVLAIAGFFFLGWQYWNNPQWLEAQEDAGPNDGLSSLLDPSSNPDNNNPLSPDDQAAIGADIDSLPVLMNELKKGGTAAQGQNAANANQANQPQGLFDTILRQQEEAKKKPPAPSLLSSAPKEPANESQPNPFLTPLNLLGNSNSNNTANIGLPTVARSNANNSNSSDSSFLNLFNPNNGTGSNPNNSNNNPPQASVLETAIRNLSGTGNSANNSANNTANNTAQTAPTNLPQSGTGSVPPSSTSLTVTSGSAGNSTPNAFTYLNQPNSVPQGYSTPLVPAPTALPSAPTTVPIVPTTTVPGLPTGPTTSGVNSNGVGAFRPPSNSTLNNSAMQPSQLASPNQNQFNTRPAPRPYPGRAIGGGQINTFSNPTGN